MKYKCLILDHDDTVVDSTRHTHYPAHVAILKRMRPERKPISLNHWFLKNFSPGILEYYQEELGFSTEEMYKEYEYWQEFIKDKVSPFFPGIPEILHEFQKRGGLITVVSHSTIPVIQKDYEVHMAEIQPKTIFGWDFDNEKRKPHPYPVYEILKEHGLKPSEALVVDDLKPGIDMARAAGVDAVGAGWAYHVPEIEAALRETCLAYFKEVNELREFLFG